MTLPTLEWLTRWILIFAIPWFLLSIALEVLVLRRPRFKTARGFELRDSFASLSMGLINLFVMAGVAAFTLAVSFAVYEHRLFDLAPSLVWTWPLLWLAEDFCYYWYHRCSHRIRLFWAAHVNHHSSRHYNLTTALRQSTTSPLYGFVFWLPLPLLGFHPLAVALMHSFSLLYQFWIHTEAIDRLGVLEQVLNTPSHHRVHHGSNPEYIDKNFGGWLIVWDRLFGSYAREREDLKVRYGLVHDIDSYNPITISFHEWAHMLRRVLAARSLREAVGWVLRPPEWEPARELADKPTATA